MTGSSHWAQAAVEDVSHGDVSSLAEAIAHLRSSGDAESEAWSLSLESNGALLTGAPPPAAAAIEACIARGGPRPVCAEAAYLASFTHAIDLDRESARSHLPAMEGTAWSELARAFGAISDGSYDDALGRARSVAAGARTSPRLTTGAAIVSALATLESGNAPEAVTLARRAMRMARTEGIVADEYLAGLVLARTRRSAQTTQAAIRILGALARVVPPRWLAAVTWEAWFSGAIDVVRHAAARMDAHPSAASDLSRRLLSFLTSSEAAAEIANAADATSIRPLRRELSALLAAVGLEPLESTSERVAAWLRGAFDEVPSELAGLSSPAVDIEGFEHAATYAVGGVFESPRRVLGLGLPTLFGRPVDPRGEPRSHLRQCSTAAALLLAGDEGLEGRTLFERVYGFAYDERHGAVFRNSITKTRAWLGERGEIEWREGRYFLVAKQAPLVLPDPRTTPPIAEVILRAVAAAPQGIGARDIAGALNLPLRTVQAHLGELVASGACESRREGNANLYRMEDTTFGEPTFTRLTPKV
jgi:DNA-binding transcriptional ArsR family regulator